MIIIKMKKINNKTLGYIFMIVGFLIIIINAYEYVFNNNSSFIATTTIGLALVVVGMMYSKKD